MVSKNSGVTCVAGTRGGVEGLVRPGMTTGPSIPLPPTPKGAASAEETNPRHGSRGILHPIVEGGGRILGIFLAGGRDEGDGEESVGIVADVDAGEIAEALNGEAGPGEKYGGHGDFAGNREPAEALTARVAGASASGLERFEHAGADDSQEGDDGEKKRSEQSDGERVENGFSIEIDFSHARQQAGLGGNGGGHHPLGGEDADSSAGEGEEQAFGKKQTDELRATGAECESDGHFAAS